MSDKDAEIVIIEREVALANTAEIAALKAEVARLKPWSLALQDLTPGGSEFQTPEACLAYARSVRARQMDQIKRFMRAKVATIAIAEAAEARVAKLEAGLKPFADALYELDGSERVDMVHLENDQLVTTALEVTAGDFRRAHALLNQDKTNG